MIKTIINGGLLIAFLSTVLGNYIKEYIPLDYSVVIGIIGLISLKFLISYGIRTVLFFSLKVLVVQAVLMNFFDWIIPEYYNYTKTISLVASPLIIIYGFDRFKILFENILLTPLGLVKKNYDNVFNNISKDNAGINLTIEQIDSLGNNGRDFEDYIAKLYRACGFISKTTMELKEENDLPESIMKSSGNGEQGADVLVFFNEPQNIKGKMFDGLLIQCKHYKNKVDNKAVQEAKGAIAMYEKHFVKKLHPMVITNNYLTQPALNLANANEVSVHDRDTLPNLVKYAVETMNNIKKQMVA